MYLRIIEICYFNMEGTLCILDNTTKRVKINES